MSNKEKTIEKVRRDIVTELLCQILEHGSGIDLENHEMMGLIHEELLEMQQAINETNPMTMTEKAEAQGGVHRIYAEGVQATALLIRFLINLKTKEMRGTNYGDDE